MNDILYKGDRERIKAMAAREPSMLRYIEALEKIAEISVEAWRNTPHAKREVLASIMNDLYDALTVVSWLNEDE